MTEEEKQDRKTIRKYDQCGLGKRFLYMPGRFRPRKYAIPYEDITHVFKRVAVSPGSGKAFLTPILYIVVLTRDGKEIQNSFRYLDDADHMITQLEKEHPGICLMSPKEEKKKEEKEERERLIQSTQLSPSARKAKQKLERAKQKLEKRPGLSERLAATASVKRKLDLIKPGYVALAAVLLAAGAALVLIGFLMVLSGMRSSGVVLILLVGFALLFIMGNSRVLPTPKRNKKALNRDYEHLIKEMSNYVKDEEHFPIDVHYAHPYTCDRLIRILMERRAETIDDAMRVLKEDLKSMDSSVALSGEEYRQVVTIKPLFTVRNYQ